MCDKSLRKKETVLPFAGDSSLTGETYEHNKYHKKTHGPPEKLWGSVIVLHYVNHAFGVNFQTCAISLITCPVSVICECVLRISVFLKQVNNFILFSSDPHKSL